MSSEEDEPSPPRKRGRPSKSDTSPRKPKKPSDDDLDGKHYACDVCDQVFLHKSNYLRHTQRHEPPGGFVCTLCYQTFTSDWDRSRHKRYEHSVFRCRICQAEFPVEADYMAHIQQEHEGRNCDYDMCPKCGQQFKSASQLKVHIESNCGTEKKHKCSECDSLYLTQASLNAHMIKHVGEKSHLCNYCGASFLNKGQLKVHERMHTGEKPYKCNQCDKAFAHRESLITHSTTHSGIKPYHCSFCESRFSCIGNLLKHRRARPDTCGLPQHCLTNKIVPRPNIKTMPNLTDRSVNASKVVQRSGPPRPRAPKVADSSDEVKPVVVKKPTKPKVETYGDSSESSEEEAPEEIKPKIPKVSTVTSKVRKVSKPQPKLVKLKVEHSSNEDETYDDSSNSKAEFLETPNLIDVVEVKVEEDDDQGDYKVVEDISQEILYETVIEAEELIDLPDDDDKYQDADSSNDYKPPEPVYDEKGIRRTFSEKPPVITDKRRRGRPKKPPPPPLDPDKVVILDLDHQRREIEAQRSIYEESVTQITSDCYRCNHCPIQYVSPYLAGKHLEKEHGIVLKELVKTLQYDREYTRERKYQCRFCGRMYANEKALEKHVLLHGPDGRLIHKCQCCAQHFETEEEVLLHGKTEHPERLLCVECDIVFREHEKLVRHRNQQHVEEKIIKKYHYVCPICGKSFSSRAAVSDHERSNCGRNPIYTCEICLKSFHTSSSLKNHYSLHSNELPFSCQFCGKSYRTKGQVKVHERQHTGEKPFHCEFCPKSFAHRESLSTHRSSHTGIKRFMCSGCGQRFTCVSNLQAHKRSHKDTCGTVPNVSRVAGPEGYHELPKGYVIPFPKYEVVDSN